MARPDSWVKDYEAVDFDVPFTPTNINLSERERMLNESSKSSTPEPEQEQHHQHQLRQPPPPPPKDAARTSLVGGGGGGGRVVSSGSGAGLDDRTRVSRYTLSDPGFLPPVSSRASVVLVSSSSAQQQPQHLPSSPTVAQQTYPHTHTRTLSSDQLLPSSPPASSPTFPPTSPPATHTHTNIHTQPPVVFPSGTGINTSGVPMARVPRSASFKGSPLNPSGSSPASSINNGQAPAPSTPTLQPHSPSSFTSPFARPGSRGSTYFARLASEESRALSWGGQEQRGVGTATPSSTAGSIPALPTRGSMILYRVALPDPSAPSPGQSLPPSFSSGSSPLNHGTTPPTAAEDGGLLPPPSFSQLNRASVYSTSGDSIVSMGSDSKYPAGLGFGVGLGLSSPHSQAGVGSGGGLVAYAYDPDDDSDGEGDEPDPLHDLDYPPPPYTRDRAKASARAGKRSSDATSSSTPSSSSNGKGKEKAPSTSSQHSVRRVYAGEVYEPYPPHLAFLSSSSAPFSSLSHLSWRGLVNVSAIMLLLLALLCLFIGFPVISVVRDDGRSVLITMNTRINSTGQAVAFDFDPETGVVATREEERKREEIEDLAGWAVEKDRYGREEIEDVELWAVEKDPFGRREEVREQVEDLEAWAVEKDPFGRREQLEDVGPWAVEKDLFGRREEVEDVEGWAVEKDVFGRREVQEVLGSPLSPLSPPSPASPQSNVQLKPQLLEANPDTFIDRATPLSAHTLHLNDINAVDSLRALNIVDTDFKLILSMEFPSGPRPGSVTMGQACLDLDLDVASGGVLVEVGYVRQYQGGWKEEDRKDGVLSRIRGTGRTGMGGGAGREGVEGGVGRNHHGPIGQEKQEQETRGRALYWINARGDSNLVHSTKGLVSSSSSSTLILASGSASQEERSKHINLSLLLGLRHLSREPVEDEQGPKVEYVRLYAPASRAGVVSCVADKVESVVAELTLNIDTERMS
ncbi:unnamed protein product [Cyclocybe aegerita]|uniref:Uncharacterized protein n=1 Tax=Cyclocybe aegerita TaxID=1973307 RepID=A0A8S0WCA8_CYCAE|nr:unnamed protein product [Cyclocybe aegerita]